MSIKFIKPEYDGGRILARTGQIDVGAIFPFSDGSADWAFWLNQRITTHVRARSVLVAKTALINRFEEWLRLAALAPDEQTARVQDRLAHLLEAPK